MTSKLWQKQKLVHPRKDAFPFYLYFDDFKSGSHGGVHAIGAIYCTFPYLL